MTESYLTNCNSTIVDVEDIIFQEKESSEATNKNICFNSKDPKTLEDSIPFQDSNSPQFSKNAQLIVQREREKAINHRNESRQSYDNYLWSDHPQIQNNSYVENSTTSLRTHRNNIERCTSDIMDRRDVTSRERHRLMRLSNSDKKLGDFSLEEKMQQLSDADENDSKGKKQLTRAYPSVSNDTKHNGELSIRKLSDCTGHRRQRSLSQKNSDHSILEQLDHLEDNCSTVPFFKSYPDPTSSEDYLRNKNHIYKREVSPEFTVYKSTFQRSSSLKGHENDKTEKDNPGGDSHYTHYHEMEREKGKKTEYSPCHTKNEMLKDDFGRVKSTSLKQSEQLSKATDDCEEALKRDKKQRNETYDGLFGHERHHTPEYYDRMIQKINEQIYLAVGRSKNSSTLNGSGTDDDNWC